jgi:hypothetical protein
MMFWASFEVRLKVIARDLSHVEHRRWQLGWHHSGRAWGHPTAFRLHIDFRDCENCESSYRIFQSTFNVLQLFKMFSVL